MALEGIANIRNDDMRKGIGVLGEEDHKHDAIQKGKASDSNTVIGCRALRENGDEDDPKRREECELAQHDRVKQQHDEQRRGGAKTRGASRNIRKRMGSSGLEVIPTR